MLICFIHNKLGFALKDVVAGSKGKKSQWAITRSENHFELSQICFSDSLGKDFQLAEIYAF